MMVSEVKSIEMYDKKDYFEHFVPNLCFKAMAMLQVLKEINIQKQLFYYP